VTAVLICEDHHEVRDRLATVSATLGGGSRINSCGTATGEVLAHYNPRTIDLVLLGTHPGQRAGLITLRALLAAHPGANVLTFGAPDDTTAIAATVALGARGYLRWDAARPHMVATLAHAVTAPGTLRPAPSTPIHDPSRLSEREHQVLLGMSEGKSNGQIGRELFLAEDTIKTHARRMFRKLGVGDRAEAVAHGFRHNLLT
jgi:DNA-binding NarL/FixJ family response regulator